MRLTPAQFVLLRAVADGQVTEHFPSGRAPWSQRDHGEQRHGRRYQTVTAAVGKLLFAGLVRLGERPPGRVTSTWLLTEKGRASL